MNAGSDQLSPRDDLLYLAYLTARGIKPLSRWEMDITPEQRVEIERLGLHVSSFTRCTEWGRMVSHTIFSFTGRRSAARRSATTINLSAVKDWILAIPLAA